jgi:hypothetical protein
MKKESKLKYSLLFMIFVLICVNFSNVLANQWASRDTQYTALGESCSRGNNYAYWIKTTPTGTTSTVINLSIVFNSTGSVGNCSEWQNITRTICCPEGYQCSINGKCIEEIKNPCEDFTNRQDCENTNIISTGDNPAERFFRFMRDEQNLNVYNNKCRNEGGDVYMEVEGGQLCRDFSKCLCAWEASSCKAKYDDYAVCANGNRYKNTSCYYEVANIDNQCETLGKTIITYKVTPSPPSKNCEIPAPREVSCSAIAVVPFFNFTNLIISLLSILTVYLLIRDP